MRPSVFIILVDVLISGGAFVGCDPEIWERAQDGEIRIVFPLQLLAWHNDMFEFANAIPFSLSHIFLTQK